MGIIAAYSWDETPSLHLQPETSSLCSLARRDCWGGEMCELWASVIAARRLYQLQVAVATYVLDRINVEGVSKYLGVSSLPWFSLSFTCSLFCANNKLLHPLSLLFRFLFPLLFYFFLLLKQPSVSTNRNNQSWLKKQRKHLQVVLCPVLTLASFHWNPLQGTEWSKRE